ncbi:hypothetical protein [Micromonospora sp. NPDC048898]|uniref:hypothetical protein n=1 Tax=Micromonospora sp. NPDC048898 TaxID=3364260 RepID=UPI00371B3041
MAALLAVTLAAPALWIAVSTYRDQQALTREQLELTRLERERYEQRFASRVAFWIPTEDEVRRPKGIAFVVRVQNRSPVPIGSIVIAPRFPQALDVGFFSTVDIPPCSLITLGLDHEGAVRSMTLPDRGLPMLGMSFYDSVGIWAIGSSGVQRTMGTRLRPSIGAAELPGTREVLSDCGEGG